MEINNCPFCGSDKVDLAYRKNGRHVTVRVHCDSCQAEGPVTVNKEYVIELWNRALQPVPA